MDKLSDIHPQLLKCAALIKLKSMDYGDPDHAKRSYFPYGDASYMHMILTKFQRLKNLADKKIRGETVNNQFEPYTDTLRDLINYCAFYLQYLEEEDEHNRDV